MGRWTASSGGVNELARQLAQISDDLENVKNEVDARPVYFFAMYLPHPSEARLLLCDSLVPQAMLTATHCAD